MVAHFQNLISKGMSMLQILKKDEVYKSLCFPYFPSIYGRHFTVGK